MTILKNKSKVSTIALVLVLAIAVSLVALPAVTAQTTKTTYAYIGAIPNPVGVGQEVLLHVGITDYLLIEGHGWEGLTVTVERPDGTTETLGPFRTDATGGTGTVYVPAQVGTHYLQTHFPEQEYTWISPPIFDPELKGTILYEASDSTKLALIVQEEPVEYYPSHELPTEYWTRPIDAQLREWSSISGSWLESPPNMFAPYNDGPETAHILWAKPLAMGGLAGGELGPQGMECGDAYEGKYSSSVIINGILYYNKFEERSPQQEVVAVDLRTGEELWSKPLLDPEGVSRRLEFGQLFYWDSYNYHGVFAYLWTTADWGRTWHAYEALTGEWMYTMENVPTAAVRWGPRFKVCGAKGEFYIYTINLEQGWMTLWNSSRVVSTKGSWRPHGRTFDAERGYEWNKTIPEGLPGGVSAVFLFDRVIGSNHTGWIGLGDLPITTWGISLKPGQEGQLLFKETWQPPSGDLSMSFVGASLEDGVFTVSCKEKRQWYGFSLDDGKELWGPTQSQAYLDSIGIMRGTIAYGKLFSVGMGGVVYCYDVKTGDLDWTYEATDPLSEILWSNNWPLRTLFITDGKIYLGHSEHSPIDPKPRGAPTICLDAETGEEIFRADGLFRQTDWGGRAIIGDSIIATYNSYDQRIYAIGKGPSATEVSASPKIIANGASVLIEGRVTDQSPGAKGTPAIADEHMSEWMQYLYKQFPIPENPTGVEVTLDAIDPDGNYINIATVTSDMSGMFKKMWTPEVPGEYTIFATFMGSKSYWPSYAATAIGVSEAPEEPTPAEPEPTEAPAYTAIDLAIIAAVVVAIIIGIVNLYALRKRK